MQDASAFARHSIRTVRRTEALKGSSQALWDADATTEWRGENSITCAEMNV